MHKARLLEILNVDKVKVEKDCQFVFLPRGTVVYKTIVITTALKKNWIKDLATSKVLESEQESRFTKCRLNQTPFK